MPSENTIEEQVLHFFSGYAYKPFVAYSAIIILLFLSSFGLPVPEEIVLISAGIVSYMGMNPEIFPPPYEGASPVNAYTAASVALASVVISDLLVFTIGHHFGKRLYRFRLMKRYESQITKISFYTKKYGQWAAGVFRFTPGLRFPGHLTCGIMGLSYTRFILVDGTAAVISVPTQIILVAFLGDSILQYLQKFKTGLLIIIGILIIFLILWKLFSKKRPTGSVKTEYLPEPD